jgi:hypothetical protein
MALVVVLIVFAHVLIGAMLWIGPRWAATANPKSGVSSARFREARPQPAPVRIPRLQPWASSRFGAAAVGAFPGGPMVDTGHW